MCYRYVKENSIKKFLHIVFKLNTEKLGSKIRVDGKKEDKIL